MTNLLRPNHVEKTTFKSFFIYAKKGCPRRSLESTALYKYLVANDLLAVNHPKNADLIIVYTCGGFVHDELFSLLSIEKALKSGAQQVVVSGCLPKINPDILKTYKNILIISPDELEKFDSLINAKIPINSLPRVSTVSGINDLYHGDLFYRFKRNFRLGSGILKKVSSVILNRLHKPYSIISDKELYRLEIAKGCLNQCSFCAIKRAMPQFHSFPQNEIIDDFRKGLADGYKNFALIAGDIGCYGFDTGTNLPRLLEELFKVTGEYKIALIDMNARWFIKYYSEFLQVLKLNSEKVSLIMLPIQSGSNKILKLMNRSYNIDEVKECILDLKKNVPGIKIETHIMVGFPGETAEDFSKSVQLIKEIPFSRVEIYEYQERPGTEALSLPGKVPMDEIKKRVKYLKRKIEPDAH